VTTGKKNDEAFPLELPCLKVDLLFDPFFFKKQKDVLKLLQHDQTDAKETFAFDLCDLRVDLISPSIFFSKTKCVPRLLNDDEKAAEEALALNSFASELTKGKDKDEKEKGTHSRGLS